MALWNCFGRKTSFQAELRMSSRSGMIIDVYKGTADVQLPDGRVVRRVCFSEGIRREVGQGVTMERVGDDWQIVGISMLSSVISVDSRVFTLGEWMQIFGDPALATCGQDETAEPLPDILNLFPLFSNERERRGLNSVNLGLVVAGPLYISAHGYFDVGLNGVESLRVKAWSLTDDTLKWTFEFELRGIEATPAYQLTSNFFFDPDKKTLNIAYLDFYTLQLSDDYITLPTMAKLTQTLPGGIITKTSSVAWDSACMLEDVFATTLKKNSDNNRWISLGANDMRNQFSGYFLFSEFAVPQGAPNRGAPHVMETNRFYAVMLAAKDVLINDQGFDTHPENGTISYYEYPTYHRYLAGKIFSFPRTGGLIAASIYERSTYTVTDMDSFTDAVTARAGDYPVVVITAFWGRTLPPGTSTNTQTTYTYGGVMPDQGMYTGPSHSGGPPFYSAFKRYREQQMPPCLDYPCPRTVSGNSNGWNEGDNYGTPGAVTLSNGLVLQAFISASAILRYDIDVDEIQRDTYPFGTADGWNYVSETTVGFSQTWIAGTGNPLDTGYIRDGYWDATMPKYSIPLHTFSHETLLRWMDGGGTIAYEYKLNQKFTIGAGLVEIDVPENVWSIAIGHRTADPAYKDHAFVLHDWRPARDKLARRVVTILDPIANLKSMVQLSPLDLDGGGQYLFEMIGAEIRISFPPEGQPGDVYMIARTQAVNTTKVMADVDYYRHDLIVFDLFDLTAVTEVNRLTEYTNNAAQTTIPSVDDMNRITFGGGRILYTSKSDASDWSVKEII